MNFLKDLLNERWDEHDGPTLEDYGVTPFEPALDYIVSAWSSPQVAHYLYGEYGNHFYWDANDETDVMKSLAWVRSTPSSKESVNRLKRQLKELEASGVIAEQSLIRDRMGI